jgi:taurine dioxygenase
MLNLGVRDEDAPDHFKVKTAMQFRSIEVAPMSPHLGAEIGGIDLNKKLNDEQVEELHEAFSTYQVIFFRDQKLDYDSLKALGRSFGELSAHPIAITPEGHPEVTVLHADSNSKVIVGERWHTDVSCSAEPPLGSILYLHTVPPLGGDTLFASQYAAYDDLSDRMKAHIDGLTAFHDGGPSYRAMNRARGVAETGKTYPSANHPVVRTHPVTKRKALYVNAEFTKNINELSADEGDAILHYLVPHSTREEFQVRFHWKPHSVAFWDNRCLQHLAVWDYYPNTRSGFRVTIAGDKPY